MLPFKYRPSDDTKDELDWEDNALSNSVAFASELVFPHQCTTHGTVFATISNYMWTSCSCCLFWRGALFGAAIPTIAVALLAAAMYVF